MGIFSVFVEETCLPETIKENELKIVEYLPLGMLHVVWGIFNRECLVAAFIQF